MRYLAIILSLFCIAATPVFTPFSTNYTTDTANSLMWTVDANAPSSCAVEKNMTYAMATTYVACLNSTNYLSHDDWRLPTLTEFLYLIDAGYTISSLEAIGFSGVQREYWTGTATGNQAYKVRVYDAGYNLYMKEYPVFVWPVRTR